jgi:pSer/pThr/pTyr-binding forkhead associated (FHA) protein
MRDNPTERRRFLLDKPSFIVGRSGELTDLRIERQGVSRQHIEISCQQGRYAVRDLGSTNGTHLNGEAMAPYRAYPLQDGDILTVAETPLSFHLV